ncbi:MAG: NosD domain-containing protein [Myxococcota bacterium]
MRTRPATLLLFALATGACGYSVKCVEDADCVAPATCDPATSECREPPAASSSSSSGTGSSASSSTSSSSVSSSSASASSSSGSSTSSSSGSVSSATSSSSSSSRVSSSSSSGGAPTVEPYYAAAPDWGDWIVRDAPDDLTAGGTACAPGAYDCFHAGAMRAVPITGNCTGITAHDDLDALAWTCVDGVPARVVSTGLQRGRRLADLLDTDAPAWRTNRVHVERNGSPVFSTDAATWWFTPVQTTTGGSITEAGVWIYEEGAPVAVTIETTHVSLVLPTTPTPQAGAFPAIQSAPESLEPSEFLWLEGALSGEAVSPPGAEEALVRLSNGFGVLRLLEVSNSVRACVHVRDRNGYVLEDVVAHECEDGIWLHYTDRPRCTRCTAYNCVTGVAISGVNDGTFIDTLVANNAGTGGAGVGLTLVNESRRNVIIGTRAFNNATGVHLVGSHDNVLVETFSTNNGAESSGAGLFLSAYSTGNVLLASTLANGIYYGLDVYTSSRTTISSVLAHNHDGSSVMVHGEAVQPTSETTVADVATESVTLSFAHDGHFTGVLARPASGICQVADSVRPGLLPDCSAETNVSDSQVRTLSSGLGTSVVGPQTPTQRNYGSDVPWTAPVDERAWGLAGAAGSAQAQGRWSTGAGLQWDWSLRSTDSQVRNALPPEDSVLVHRWSAEDEPACGLIPGAQWTSRCPVPPYPATDCPVPDAGMVLGCFSEHHRRALELVDDNVGNNNGLCESDERCVRITNFGAYQGHGVPVPSSTDGGPPVTFLEHPSNGR